MTFPKMPTFSEQADVRSFESATFNTHGYVFWAPLIMVIAMFNVTLASDVCLETAP